MIVFEISTRSDGRANEHFPRFSLASNISRLNEP